MKEMRRRETHHYLVAHDGDLIRDFIEVAENELLALGIEPVDCNYALLIHGVTYQEIDKKKILGSKHKFGESLVSKFIDRVAKNDWRLDYVASWMDDLEISQEKRRVDVYKHRIADLTGHGERHPCDDY